MGWKGDNKYRAFSAENLEKTQSIYKDETVNYCEVQSLPKYCPTLADDDERLLVGVVWVDVTDGSAGELKWKLTIPPRQIIAYNYKLSL